ncbi:MAG: A/G-specific adenine glycosylase [Candidatus Aminicenantes bacterium]|nr:A/G-specific adenine glycosylase [Candidatus Aminicenantes bacterium]
MSSQNQRINEFRIRLLHWFRDHHRKLPWRETQDPYKIWISEIMLQQTTVQAVLPYYRKWEKLFPDMESLSRAPLQRVLKAWQGLGYYQRARNLHKASRIMKDKFEGKIPSDYDELKKLPGFGPYTTAAIMSFAFDKTYPVVDANVRRVIIRLRRIRQKASPDDKALLPFLQTQLPLKKSCHFNQALMELGALVCRPKNPRCLLCPVTEFCQAYQTGEQEVIPPPKKRNYKKIEAVVGIIRKNSQILIQKRPSSGLLAELWEFPGGKRATGESLEQALDREIKEELSAEVAEKKFLTKVHHAYTQFQVDLYAYECRLKSEPRFNTRQRWVTLRAIRRYPVPSGSAKIIKFLEQREKIKHQA